MSALVSRLGEHPLIQQLLSGSVEDDLEWASSGAISANRVLVLNADNEAAYFDPLAVDYPVVLGVSITAVSTQGELLRIRRSGLMTDSNWAFQPRYPIWAGQDGFFAQTPLAGGWSVQIGEALASQQIFIKLSEVIKL